jgi:GTP-binding protein EngB required for normal cell division
VTEPKKPLVVFVGRSNVGKSSIIRALTGRRVRVGKRPGSTKWEQRIDLGSVVLVDMAGFGYMAGQSKQAIEDMKVSLVQKLEKWSKSIVLSVLILDISLFRELFDRWDGRGEIPIDVEFYRFLAEITPRVIVVANKSDKIKKRKHESEIEYLIEKLVEAIPGVYPSVIATSASKSQGIEDLRSTMEECMISAGLSEPTWYGPI